jgi:hypothetical protein
MVLRDAARLVQHFERRQEGAIIEGTCGQEHCDLVHLASLNTKMLMPMFKAFNNGGLPARRTGARVKIGPLEVSGAEAVTLLFRVVVLALLVYAVLAIQGVRFHVADGRLDVGREACP